MAARSAAPWPTMPVSAAPARVQCTAPCRTAAPALHKCHCYGEASASVCCAARLAPACVLAVRQGCAPSQPALEIAATPPMARWRPSAANQTPTLTLRCAPFAANPRRAESTAGSSMETTAERARARDDAVSRHTECCIQPGRVVCAPHSTARNWCLTLLEMAHRPGTSPLPPCGKTSFQWNAPREWWNPFL